jgi:hypothetical protein
MKTTISPKVWAGANVATILALVVTLCGALTPDSLDFLGKWAPLVYSLITIAAFAITAYLKTDSLRDAGVAALQKAADEAAAAALASKQTSLAATAVDPAAPVSFASTQAKVDALPAEVTPVFTPPAA